ISLGLATFALGLAVAFVVVGNGILGGVVSPPEINRKGPGSVTEAAAEIQKPPARVPYDVRRNSFEFMRMSPERRLCILETGFDVLANDPVANEFQKRIASLAPFYKCDPGWIADVTIDIIGSLSIRGIDASPSEILNALEVVVIGDPDHEPGELTCEN